MSDPNVDASDPNCPTDHAHPIPRSLTRREFVLGTAALAGLSAVGLAGCGPGAVAEPKPPNVWVPVSIAGLKTGFPQWVQFETKGLQTTPPNSPTASTAGATTDSNASPTPAPVTPAPTPAPVPAEAPATPVGSPADALMATQGAAWFVKEADGSVVAFIPFCTHQLCLYDWDAIEGDFHCRCHEGRFDVTGRQTKGPPPRPLWHAELRPTTDPGIVLLGWYRKG